MRTNLLMGVAILAMAGAASAAGAATRVEIRDAAARVTVIPENRSDVAVQFITTNPGLPIHVDTFGDRLVVDGDLKRRIKQCGGSRWNLDINGHHSEGQNVGVTVRGLGRVAWADLPQIVIRTPLRTQVGASGAVFGSIGRAASVNLDNAGCGDWTVANVNGPLDVDVAGSGDVRAGMARQLRVSIAGSGDVATQPIDGPADVHIAGSGDVRLASVAGALRADIAGSGDVKVDGGRASSVDAHIAGSGDVDFDGSAQSLDVSIAGSGDVRVRQVSGPVRKHVLGSGSVYVNGQEIGRNHDGDRDRDHDRDDDDDRS